MKSSAGKMETVSQYINWARSEGYDQDFVIRDQKLCAMEDSKVYNGKDAKIVGFHRFEGESDPGDSAIAYMIETNDGKKGTLVDAYGMYADAIVTKFMGSMYQDIRYNPESAT
jgi:hypothetical protein